jgi:PhnB protein
MSTLGRSHVSSEVQPVPEGHATVAPWIVTQDTAREIEFLTAAFDGMELGRMQGEDGSIVHAEVRIGDFTVLLFDAKEDWPDTAALLRVYMRDIDEVFERALRAGATSVTELRNFPWGDRGGRIRDPLGNIWWLSEHIEDVEPEIQGQRWADPEYIETVRYAQESLDQELSGRRASGTSA